MTYYKKKMLYNNNNNNKSEKLKIVAILSTRKYERILPFMCNFSFPFLKNKHHDLYFDRQFCSDN